MYVYSCEKAGRVRHLRTFDRRELGNKSWGVRTCQKSFDLGLQLPWVFLSVLAFLSLGGCEKYGVGLIRFLHNDRLPALTAGPFVGSAWLAMLAMLAVTKRPSSGTLSHCRDCAVAASRSEARAPRAEGTGRVFAFKGVSTGDWQGIATGQVTPTSISSLGRMS